MATSVTSSSTDSSGESLSGSLQSSNTTVNTSPEREPEKAEAATVSRYADGIPTPLSDQQPKVNGESKNDPPKNKADQARAEEPSKAQMLEIGGDRTTKEAEIAFLEMFRSLKEDYYGNHDPMGSLPNAHNFILRMENEMPLDWRKRQAQQFSFVLHAYLRLLEDR
jgi:hypothetical protein